MTDTIEIKKAMLQKKRLELSIDESEVRILDLQTEIENVQNKITKIREEIALKDKEIITLKGGNKQ